jgi:CHAT domain-containing protein
MQVLKKNRHKFPNLLAFSLYIGVFFYAGVNYAGVSSARSTTSQSLDSTLGPNASIYGIVGDRDSFSFDLTEAEFMLVQVKRINSDFKLVLSNGQQNMVYTVSLPSTGNWVAERILVTVNDCKKCQLQVLPIEKVDRAGNYQLIAKRLLKNNDSAELMFEAKMTQASIGWWLSKEDKKKLSQVYHTYLQAIALAKIFGAREAKQRSAYFAAEVAHYSGKNKQAKKLANHVINANQSLLDPYRLRANYLLGELALEEQRFAQAVIYLTNAEQLTKAQDDLLMQAAISHLFGLIAVEQGQPQQAYHLFEKSYQLFAVAGDWRRAVEELINKGWSKNRKGELEIALNYFQQALSLSRSSGLLSQEVEASYRIGEVYSLWGEIDLANQYIDSAMAKMQPFANSILFGRVLQAKATVLFDSGMLQLARVVYEDALQAYMRVRSKTSEIDVRFYLGWLHSRLGEFEQASIYFEEVLEFDKKAGNKIDLGQSYLRMAETALARKKYVLALSYQQQALDYLKYIDDGHLKGELYSQAGIIYFYNKKTPTANTYFSLASQIQLKIHDYNGQIETGYRRATAQAAQGNNYRALTLLNKVIDIILVQRGKITRVDIKRNYFALQQKIGALHIKLLMRSGASATQTLQAAEMFRSQTLNEHLKQFHQKRDISPEWALKRAQLQQQLQSDVIHYHQLSNPELRKKLVKHTHKLAAQLQQLESVIEQAGNTLHPQQSPITLVNIEGIQHSLATNQLILYFDTNAEQSYLWAITHKAVNSYILADDRVIADQVTQVLALTRQAPTNYTFNRKQKQKQVYNKLVATLFNDTSILWHKYAKITVIADGPLNYLPMSMLSLPGKKSSLLEQKQITFAASLAVLAQLSQRDKSDKQRSSTKHKNRILLLANPSFRAVSNNQAQVADLRSGFNSHELIYTKKEADSILKITGDNTVLLDRDNASKQAFFSQPLEDFDILHFATHGLASFEAPSMGGLVFSNVHSDNNLLLTPEIANLSLNAQLVVLSGCETALGRLVDGDGLQGLSRAFFDAGAKRVIASLWPVQDDATAELMGAFYQSLLNDKQSPAQALRFAKLHVKNHQLKNKQKHWQDPYYWAGFVLQGVEGAWLE